MKKLGSVQGTGGVEICLLVIGVEPGLHDDRQVGRLFCATAQVRFGFSVVRQD